MIVAETAEQRIAERMVELQGRFHGHAPTGGRAIWVDDIVVVVLDEAFSPAEQTLLAHGHTDEVQHIRARFQRLEEQSFRTIVEDATGREVKSFVSNTDVDQALSFEVFLLGGEKTDMAEFEDSAEQQRGQVRGSERTDH